MGFEVIFVFVLIIAAVILFMTEYIPFEITALIITSSLMVTEILDISEGLSGLSSQATVTIGCMFIISEGLRKAGILRAVGSLFTPIAIYTALDLGVNPRTFIFAVTFAASLNFLTPVSYPTNALVYSPGRYRFSDYSKIGVPLSIMFWILGSLLIPLIWPL